MYPLQFFIGKKCYLSSVSDINTNEIILYNLSMNPNHKQVERMITKLLRTKAILSGIAFDLPDLLCNET